MDLCSDGRGGSGLQVGIRELFPAEVQAEAALFHGSHWFHAFFYQVYQCLSSSARWYLYDRTPLRHLSSMLEREKKTTKNKVKTHIVSKKVERSPLTARLGGDTNASDNLRVSVLLTNSSRYFPGHQVQARKLPQMSNNLFCFDSVNLFDL